jgi:hypothetical protein
VDKPNRDIKILVEAMAEMKQDRREPAGGAGLADLPVALTSFAGALAFTLGT